MLIGVFAIINTNAALSTIVLILGIMIVIMGVVIFFIGSTLPKRTATSSFFYTFSGFADAKPETRSQNSRIIVNIDDDDAEEIDFKDIH